MTSRLVESQLNKFAKTDKAKNLSRFFKTGKGEYGEGDIFIGVVVPQIRLIAKKNMEMPFSELQKLITGKIHEYRLAALLILTYKYAGADMRIKQQIVKFYLNLCCHKIYGKEESQF